VTRSELVDVVEQWRQALLPEWRILLVDHPPPAADEDDEDNEYFATCQTAVDYDELRVYFTDDCLERPDEEVHVTVVHELLHALMRPHRALLEELAPQVTMAVYTVISARRRHDEEHLVERLSRALVAQALKAEGVGPATVRPA